MRSSIARWGAAGLFLAASLFHGGAARAASGVPVDPNDPGFPLQWNLQLIGAPVAWQKGTGAGITIAVLDSGIDFAHPELKDKVIGHVTCVGSAGDETKCVDGGLDDNGHGTHVAGIAAAATNNGTGIAGVAPDAAILDVKVLTQTCDPGGAVCDATGDSDDVAAGIRYAADHGASVINLSLGEQAQSLIGPTFQSAIDYAFNKEPEGAIPVLAAGNNFVLPSGGALNAIVVGALDKDRTKSSYSNNIGDAKWALMAPGGEADTKDSCSSAPNGVLSTYPSNGYACLAGTSMAAPHVAGAAAVLRSMGLSKQATIDRLLSTARKMDPSAVYGSGALDLAAATGATPPATTTTTAPATDASGLSEGPISSTSLDTGSSSESTASSTAGPPASAPAGDLSGPTSTAPPGVITLPDQRAAGSAGGGVTVRTPAKKGGDVSAGFIAAAVAAAAGVSAAVLLFFVRGSTRRTPRPPRPRLRE